MKKQVDPTGELRPTSLTEYVGQDHLKAGLKRALDGARARKEPLDHTLAYGPPGLGKTTLAGIIANEMGGRLVAQSSSALQQAKTLTNVLKGIEAFDVLFIDEIHRLPAKVEELLYPAIEDHHIDINIGSGVYTRTWRLDLPPFTLVGATTHLSRVSEPLRDRFGLLYRLDYYTEPELCGVVARAASVRGLTADKDACAAIAARSKGTARLADRFVRRVRDYAKGQNVDLAAVTACMADLDIDALGLDAIDRRILRAMVERYDGGPVGLATLATVANEDEETVQDVYEPYLLRIDFLNRTPRGRIVTEAGVKYVANA